MHFRFTDPSSFAYRTSSDATGQDRLGPMSFMYLETPDLTRTRFTGLIYLNSIMAFKEPGRVVYRLHALTYEIRIIPYFYIALLREERVRFLPWPSLHFLPFPAPFVLLTMHLVYVHYPCLLFLHMYYPYIMDSTQTSN